jgi:Zn-finger protein
MDYVVAIDFDGTLFLDSYPGRGVLCRPVINQAKFLKNLGVHFVLWTCREGEPLADAVRRCKEEGLEFDAVNDNTDEVETWLGTHMTADGARYGQHKVFADLYVDDSAKGSVEFFLSIRRVEDLPTGGMAPSRRARLPWAAKADASLDLSAGWGHKGFRNTSCEYWSCHIGDVNCLFCFCPLYHLDCGGDFCFTEAGIKDCSGCMLPHSEDGYDRVIGVLKRINEEKKKEQKI